jgi:hypothetical protein
LEFEGDVPTISSEMASAMELVEVRQIERLHEANGTVCFVVGMGLNTVLFWLVQTKTNDDLRLYSRVLLQTVFVDVATLVAFFLVNPVRVLGGIGAVSQEYRETALQIMLSVDGGLIDYGVGVLMNLGDYRLFNTMVMTVWNTITTFELYSVHCQFVYRYLALCR